MNLAKFVDKLTAAYPDLSFKKISENVAMTFPDDVSWRRLRLAFDDTGSKKTGLCVNLLQFPPKALRPFPLKFHKTARQNLRSNADLQKTIAAAFWYTTWAQGAVRGAPGETRPVAFLAVDRSNAFRKANKKNPAKFLEIAKQHFILGDETIEQHKLKIEVAKGKISWDGTQFVGDCPPKLLAALNERAFVDQYIGQNCEPEKNYTPEKLIPVNGSHHISRLLQGELARFAADAGRGLPEKIAAAVNGGFFLNFPEEYEHHLSAMNDPVGLLMRNGQFEQLPLARRGAFLSRESGKAEIVVVGMEDFELRLPWEKNWLTCDEENGFVVNEASRAGARKVIYTPFFAANLPPGDQKTPVGETVDFALVFGEIVEIKSGGALAIPPNGVAVSLPQSQASFLEILENLKKFGGEAEFRLAPPIENPNDPVVNAIGAGPVLLDDTGIISEDFFIHAQPDRNGESTQDTAFPRRLKTTHATSFPRRRESVAVARLLDSRLRGNDVTKRRGNDAAKRPLEEFLGMSFQDGKIIVNGAAPTRFPHDTDQTRAPRTVLGLLNDHEAAIVVIDGRNAEHSVGATLREAAEVAKAFGCKQALNLDGGGSSVLFLKKEISADHKLAADLETGIVNLPSDRGGRDRLMPVPLFVLGSASK